MTRRIEINGQAAGAGDLAALALVNYGHFTTMQVRERRARGFDLHLDRLERATHELFGLALDRARVRAWIGRVLDDAPATLRVTVFSRAFDPAWPGRAAAVDVLVAAGVAREPASVPLRVRSVVHERVLAHIKHVGTFDLFHQRRAAREAGFDDALLTTAAGAIAEGSVWNIGFWDGRSIVLPDAPALAGVTSQLVERGLAARGVPVVRRSVRAGDYDGLRSAFAMNTTAAATPIASIDDHAFLVDAALLRMLDDCHEAQPAEAI